MFLPSYLIKKKRNGEALLANEIKFFIDGYTSGEIPDYQMSALLMAIYFQGLNKEETFALTDCMLKSGKILSFPKLPAFKVDKHSTGGVGDKTSVILGPIVACCGLYVPMISGRGLGHTGGTLDKLESIPGFRIDLSFEEFEKVLTEVKVCFIGQTGEICPADKKIYALRDVTSTVENLSLICASIMSKKIAEGSDGIVLDVKYGSGAFMKTPADAEKLALGLMEVARAYGKKVMALLSTMEQPLGRFAGNALEIQECVSILKGEKHLGPAGYDLYQSTKELSLALSAWMVMLSGKFDNYESCHAEAVRVLASGAALNKFEEMCQKQGGDLRKVTISSQKFDVMPKNSGYLSKLDVERIGLAGVILKAGRQKTTDRVSPGTGIEFHYQIGDLVREDHALYTLYGDSTEDLQAANEFLRGSFEVTKQKVDRPPLILKTLI